ncbi:MAG: hypothetical protein JRD03_12325 [Deltaproteobacteria bacterium]|nr:hypothetical protein [Deltaproteobacteria bacterium]
MLRTLRTLALALACLTAVAGMSNADTVLDGTTDGGAFFRIVVPDAWNGDLAIWNHGFSLAPIGPVSDLGPLAGLQLAQGYAVAASSYQQIGWSVFKTKNDLQNLVNVFKANFGAPNNVLMTGASLGGIVTTAAIEKSQIQNLAGAFTFCGAHAGSRNWDASLDIRLIYDAICADVPGAFIPGGPTGLPAPGFPGFPLSSTDMAIAAHVCTGILAPPAFRSPAQQARLDEYLAATQLPENFLLTDMGFATFGHSNLIFDPAKLNGKQGMGNDGADYSDAVPSDIERVAAHPGGANRLNKNYQPTGAVGSTVHVALHTDLDGLVIVENESEYASVAPASNFTVAVAREIVPTHCGNTGAEVAAGWESMRGWVAGGPQPTAASMQGTCSALEPFFGGPCRIDPSFVIPDMDGRVPPR